MQRLTVGFGKYSHGVNAHLAASPQDAHGDFSAIGNQNLVELQVNLS